MIEGFRSRIFKELSPDELKRVVANVFGRGSVITECRLLKGGLFNTTYLLKSDAFPDYVVLRVAPINRHLLFDFERSMMGAEPLFHKMLLDKGIPTSKVIYYDNSYNVIEREYIVIEYIKSLLMNDPSVPADAKPSLYQQVGRITSMIHNIKNHNIKEKRFGWRRPGEGDEMFARWSDFLRRFAGEIADRSSNHGVFTDHEIGSFLEVFDESSLFDEVKEASMIHTDLWEANVLVHRDEGRWEVAAVIDLDRSIFGDRDMEFASPWMINEGFLAGYGRRLDLSLEATLRRNAYRLIQAFFGAYVWLVQYDDDDAYKCEKRAALEALRHFGG